MIKIGDKVVCVVEGYISTHKGDVGIVADIGTCEFQLLGNINWYCIDHFELVNKQSKQGAKMNSVVAKLFPLTADAVLVDKHLGCDITDNAVSHIMLEGKQSDLLAVAKDREAKANKPTA